MNIENSQQLIVQKYGGTSVGTDKRILEVADHITRTVKQGTKVVAVVSAMGSSTDDLIDLANKVSSSPHLREMDMLLSTGERISMALLAMALNDKGVQTVSFTGSQAGIKTDTNHGKAKILDIVPDRLQSALDEGKVVIVAGFQGVSLDKEVTTLGRGGSDTTAVALAAALKADACEIYTDVTGVFSADPRVAPKASKINQISFDEMQEIAATGGRVLALRSVEFAKNYNVPIHVRSSFTWEQGTWVIEENEDMEKAVVSGVSHDTSEIKVTLTGLEDKPGISAKLFGALADKEVVVDMIVQNISKDGLADISFTVPKTDKQHVQVVLEELKSTNLFANIEINENIGRVSIVGAGMKSNPGVAAKMFKVLADNSINIDMISTSAIRISCVIDETRVDDAVKSLHTEFELDK